MASGCCLLVLGVALFFSLSLVPSCLYMCGVMTVCTLKVVHLASSVAPFSSDWTVCDPEHFTALMRSTLCCPAEMFLSKTPFSAHAALLLILTSDLWRGAWENKFSLQGAIYSIVSVSQPCIKIAQWAPLVGEWCLRYHWDSEMQSVWLTDKCIQRLIRCKKKEKWNKGV